ncbi:MAG: CoA transferase, partial [Pseudomonadota bacterium]
GRRAQPAEPGDAPLAGVRVLDLSRVIAGPMMGRTLAEHGAEVLRVGAPHLPSFEGLVINTGFGKRAAFCDLRDAVGRDALAALIREADVLIDGYRPGALAGHGFGLEDLQRLNPELVYLTLSAFGETGPWGGRRGYDTYVQCATGLSQDGPDGPTRLPCQPLDYLSGYLGAASAMVALQRRIEEGGFWRVELALARTAIWVWEMTDLLAHETDPPAANPSLTEVGSIMVEMDSGFGQLRAMRPAVGLSQTPPMWRSAPVPLGSSEAVWR